MIVLITDRRLGDPRRQLERLLAHARPAAIQLREKDLDGGALIALARDLAALGIPLWINDRADVARLVGAGVHLPEAGLSVADARAAGATRIGVSRHAALDVPNVDLIQLGPIFDTPGKGPPLGTGILALETAATLVAVGGIDTPERARAAIAAGADAVAVIRAAHDPVLFAELVAACG
jgi:thiamine-phosphate diphosphorylase